MRWMPPDSPDSLVVPRSHAKCTMTRADHMRHSKTRALADGAMASLLAAMRYVRMPDVLPFFPVRSRLFAKYVALFVATVSLALLANGASEIWFLSREQEAS